MRQKVLLGVNVDHVANIRQARSAVEPDPVTAAMVCELAGADGITVHLRSDRRHIQDRDLELLRETVKTRLNVEMAATDEMMEIAGRIKPDMVTIVPEKPGEVTTEGGLDVIGKREAVKKSIESLQKNGIPVSLFVNPDVEQLKVSSELGAGYVELHTGIYAETGSEQDLRKLIKAVEAGLELGLTVNAGHDLHYRNVTPVAAIPGIHELNIGHSIIARSVFVGLEKAVAQMLSLINQ
ncbi:MAG: pyridoxine 5'-phosphate synthase [bacterium]